MYKWFRRLTRLLLSLSLLVLVPLHDFALQSADAAALPSYVQTKTDFYDHLESSLLSLIDPGTDWISSLSNASSLLFNSLNRFPVWKEKRVNWAGFYLLSPSSFRVALEEEPKSTNAAIGTLQRLTSMSTDLVRARQRSLRRRFRFVAPRVVRVADTEAYPGHIACDSLSRSEIVVPLVIKRERLAKIHQDALEEQSPLGNKEGAVAVEGADRSWAGRGDGENVIIGVLDIDCESLDGFDEEDEQRLQKIADLLVERSAW